MSVMFQFLFWCWTFLCFFLQPFQPTPAPVPTPLAGWMSNPTTVAHAAVSGGGAIGLGAPSIPGILHQLLRCCHNAIVSNLSLTYNMFHCLVKLL